jgi:hypothetical protein
MNLHDMRIIISLSCDEASRLASESLDRQLTRSERWGLRFHTLACRSCHRLLRQLELLRAVAAKAPDSAHQAIRAVLPKLSSERKQRIKQLLTDARRADQS